MEKPVGFGKTRCLRSLSRQVLMNVIFFTFIFSNLLSTIFFSQPLFSSCKQKQLCSTFFPTPRFLAVIFCWDRYVAKQGKHGPEGIHQNTSKTLPNTTPKSRSETCPRNDAEHWKTWSTIPGVAFRCANLLSLETLASGFACPTNELPGQCPTSLHFFSRW